jgi:hypothetical protein
MTYDEAIEALERFSNQFVARPGNVMQQIKDAVVSEVARLESNLPPEKRMEAFGPMAQHRTSKPLTTDRTVRNGVKRLFE